MGVLLLPGIIIKVSSIVIFLLLCFAGEFSEAQLRDFIGQYPQFSSSISKHFTVMPSATISNNALQLTPDTLGPSISSLTNKAGRILLRRKFKLWEGEPGSNSTTTTVASFNSSFLISIYPISNITGEGSFVEEFQISIQFDSLFVCHVIIYGVISLTVCL